jgi:polyhydroxyalkanoate synthesis regulator protein
MKQLLLAEKPELLEKNIRLLSKRKKKLERLKKAVEKALGNNIMDKYYDMSINNCEEAIKRYEKKFQEVTGKKYTISIENMSKG